MFSRSALIIIVAYALVAAAMADDRAGNCSLKPLAKTDWSAAAAEHLLARAGFGGSPEQVERLTNMGLDEAVSYLVDYADLPYETALPPIPEELEDRPDRALLRAMTEDERRMAEEERRKKERIAFEETRLWWLDRMLHSPRPFEEKMTLFWHGHFTSGYREVRNPVFMKQQNDFLRKNALGNFRDLVLGISKDRAMLVYLDGNRNNKQQPNENYARELMELFTLGVGNYSEQDIKEAARAFTGWQFDEDGFVFRGRNHDYGEKRFLGRTGKLNGEDVVDTILDQPACTRFMAKNILAFFVRPDPERPLIEAFAGELRKNKFELRPSMKTLFKSQAFYHADSRGALVKSPVELLVGTARRLGVPVANLVSAERAVANMGQELMQPPNVKGWDGEEKWVNTATLFQRYNTIGVLINGGGDGPVRDRMQRRLERQAKRAAAEARGDAASSEPQAQARGARGDDDSDDDRDDEMMLRGKAPRTRMGGSRQPAFDPMPMVRDHNLKSAEQIVGFFLDHLLPRPLDERKREQLVAYLNSEKADFDLNAKGAADRVRIVVHLICSTPEYQLN